ncbi:MAG: phosphopentomutase [Erysipelotrichaceae bacterium]
MNRKFVVIVLDGFGIGATKDVQVERPSDKNSNTLKSILKDYPDLKLPNLEELGLMNAYGYESSKMKFSKKAIYGKCELMHHGADTFMGHQEIFGTLPKLPEIIPFQYCVDELKEHLLALQYKVEVIEKQGLKYLLVNDYCTVADNIDADLGMAYNCTACLDYMSFEEEMNIGKAVRQIAKVNRVIVFGGKKNNIDDILAAEMIKEEKYIGIHAVNSKSYIDGYQCRHLGYGVDEKVQVAHLLNEIDVDVSLFGKVADIVHNENGKSISCVDTSDVLDFTIKEMNNDHNIFICTNVQETDLAGHSQSTKWYKELLEISDKKIGTMIKLLNKEDILIIMADHGNDPLNGNNLHTRENVPLLIKCNKDINLNIGVRETLSDVGATVCDYFGSDLPENGMSFLNSIK